MAAGPPGVEPGVHNQLALALASYTSIQSLANISLATSATRAVCQCDATEGGQWPDLVPSSPKQQVSKVNFLTKLPVVVFEDFSAFSFWFGQLTAGFCLGVA